MAKDHYYWVRVDPAKETDNPVDTLRAIVLEKSGDGVLRNRGFTFTNMDVLRDMVGDRGTGRYLLFPVTVESGSEANRVDLTPVYDLDSIEFYDVP